MPGILGALFALAASVQCPQIAGVDAILSKPDVRVIWAGELHGTAEQPRAFGDLVCGAAERLKQPPVVFLERSADEQPLWDAFLSSDGGPAARAALTTAPAWRTRVQDGRNSEAIMTLAERLRMLKQAHRIIAVRLLIPSLPPAGRQAHEDRMAASIQAALSHMPDGTRALVLSGNVHASKSDVALPDETYAAAAKRLPPENVLSVLLVSGPGEAWNCQPDGCRAHADSGLQRDAGFSWDAPAGYDAMLSAGVHTTASPPAVVPVD
jgi:hypothetical protein